MLRLFLLLLVTLIAQMAIAQGRPPAFLSNPLPASSEISFKGFRGHDLATLSSALLKRLEAEPKKSEFETLAVFEERQRKWRSQPISGAIRYESRLAFSAPLTKVTANNDLTRIKFDAESNTLTMQMMNECRGGPGIVWSDVAKRIGSFVGTNTFGVKKTITRVFRSALCLQFPRPPDWLHFRDPFKIDAETAKSMVKVGHLVLIGVLVEPYRQSDLSTSEATISDPYEVTELSVAVMFEPIEVLIVDPISGRVFLRAAKPE